MAVTEEEKTRARYHLGYPDMASIAVMGMGVIGSGQPMFLLEAGFQKLRTSGEQKFREVLCECDAIEEQIKEARKRLGVAKTGTTEFRHRNEVEDLEELYERWTDKLADVLASPKNPYSYQHGDRGGGYTLV